MYTSFSIENFRLFDQLTVEPLARVNLIAGQNNAGKTALLEALSLHGFPDHPELAQFLSVLRGLPGGEPGEFFSDLFHSYRRDAVIKLNAGGDWRGAQRRLTIHRKPRTEFSMPLGALQPGRVQTSRAIFDDELVFDYCDEGDVSLTARAWAQPSHQAGGSAMTARALELQTDVSDNGAHSTPALLMGVGGRVADPELAAVFGKAVREGHLRLVVDAVKVLEPRLHELLAVPNELGTSLIYADIGDDRKMPLAVMGSGINRMLDVTLGFLYASGAAILIDEIENGLHYSLLPEVWRTINDLSNRFGVQVFATTHSYECIVAANAAFTELESDELHLHRLYRRDERVKVQTYTKAALDTNIEYLWELR